MGTPSEEQLLGPLHRPVHEMTVSFEPPPPPEWIVSETPPTDGNASESRRWRLGPRDFVALAAVATVVWLAVRTGDGLPFRSSEPAAPTAVGNVTRTTLAPDRLEPTRSAIAPTANTSGTKNGDGQKNRQDGQKDQAGSRGGSGKGDDDPPNGGGGGGGDDSTTPLLQATVPGVGTVTVDQPKVPTVTGIDVPTAPALPDAGDVLPETVTVSLP
jgi:hypothetical protein